jgi:DNA-binding CsgD family transcriptional regulator
LVVIRSAGSDLSDEEHRLEVEISTIRTHLNRIFDKLGVRRRSGVASLFARHH